ncbi:DNA-directed DNA polymerase [Handroanthus impetiginosus]|uniref:DNA-directed DNA polymerase n=1 Tax=Handroanthus impetiginosus TaxID=429701 RepID=A0A2G9HYT9_9LAMI|nr:DNA-directed DNA polymerase [Handroanthus impetiginosus]
MRRSQNQDLAPYDPEIERIFRARRRKLVEHLEQEVKVEENQNIVMADNYENTPVRNLTLPRARERRSCVVFPELPVGVKGVSETIYETWSQFKKILWNCPNHDIPRHIQVHTFYHGLTEGGKDKLDHPNGDSFLSGTTTECHNLLNNLVANHYEKNSERATTSKVVGVIEVDQVTALNDKIDFLIQSMKKFGVNQMQHTPGVQQQVQQPMQEKKPSLEKTLMQFMASTTGNFKMIETQIGQLANAINSRHQRSLWSKTEPNPRQHEKAQCQAITLCNGRELQEAVKVPTKAKGKGVIFEENEEKVEAPLEVIFKKLHINISFVEALEQMPTYIKFMIDILSKKRCLGDYEMVALTEECSAIIQNILPPKLKDPGSFTIPCTIGTHFLGRALYDLGATKPTNITLQLVDRSLTYPNKVIEDILFKVDKFIFPTNFVVLDIEVDSEIPIILGRSFLATERTFMMFKRSLERTAPSKVLKSSIEEPPTLELKPLPNHLRYAYLGEYDTLPIIISSSLSDVQVEKLLRVLRDHKSAIGWTIADIKGISPSFCMHKVLLEDDQKPSVESQSSLNPIMKKVVKKEIIKWLDAGIIYPISDNTNLILNWAKCHFMVQEGIVLGHKVSNRGIEVNKAKLKTIEKLPPPTSVKGVRSFLGHMGFYRRFIKDFSKISKPLCNLLENDVPFKFDDARLHAFNDLKGRLISVHIITVPNWSFPFELMCDVNDFAIGTILGQRKNKIFCSIYYTSKTLNDGQLNYMTTEKELLAVVFAFDKFKSYLGGTKVIVLDLEIRDRKGTENQIADHLSRLEYPTKTNKPNLINDNFPDKQLLAIVASDVPWYADIVNYLTCGIITFGLSAQQKKKILFGIRRYSWDEPFLFKQCFDHILNLFDVWGINFMGPFVPSFGNVYILVAVDYMSKWVEAVAVPKYFYPIGHP